MLFDILLTTIIGGTLYNIFRLISDMTQFEASLIAVLCVMVFVRIAEKVTYQRSLKLKNNFGKINNNK